MTTAHPSLDEFEYTLTRRALRQIKAEAWDQGAVSVIRHGLAIRNGENVPAESNPYREVGS